MESDPTPIDPTKSVSNMLRASQPEPITGSGVQSVETSDGSKAPVQRTGGKREERSAVSRARGALWRFVVLCTKPILSRLKDYFSITTLVDLARSANRRAAATWHSVGALREQTEKLARREDVENLAKHHVAKHATRSNHG